MFDPVVASGMFNYGPEFLRSWAALIGVAAVIYWLASRKD